MLKQPQDDLNHKVLGRLLKRTEIVCAHLPKCNHIFQKSEYLTYTYSMCIPMNISVVVENVCSYHQHPMLQGMP
jgi:hypothetical protein